MISRKKHGDAHMPYKPKKPCAYPGCRNLTDGRYCEAHAKAEAKRYNREERDPDSNKRYGRSWKQLRAAFLAAHPLCEMCSAEGRLTPAEEVHHIKALKNGGTNEAGNLMSLCKPCHSRITATENGGRQRKAEAHGR
jgi:5-methylcytosine-specific restriction protein A